MIRFIPAYVPPGTVYDDEPDVEVPAGWHVRLEMTPEQRTSAEWEWNAWPSRYTGRGAVEHFEAVVLAKLANEAWDRYSRMADYADVALIDAVNEMSEVSL